jgi:hypothetical protein
MDFRILKARTLDYWNKNLNEKYLDSIEKRIKGELYTVGRTI